MVTGRGPGGCGDGRTAQIGQYIPSLINTQLSLTLSVVKSSNSLASDVKHAYIQTPQAPSDPS